MSAVDNMLRHLQEEERDRPFELLEQGSDAIVRLGFEAVSRPTLHRYAAQGRHGVVLRTRTSGGKRYCTLRLLAEYFIAADEARIETIKRKHEVERASQAKAAVRSKRQCAHGKQEKTRPGDAGRAMNNTTQVSPEASHGS